MKIEVNKEDLINLVYSTSPKTMQECCDYTDVGLMKFTGHQHNEKWDWVKTELNKLYETELVNLYNKHK